MLHSCVLNWWWWWWWWWFHHIHTASQKRYIDDDPQNAKFCHPLSGIRPWLIPVLDQYREEHTYLSIAVGLSTYPSTVFQIFQIPLFVASFFLHCFSWKVYFIHFMLAAQRTFFVHPSCLLLKSCTAWRVALRWTCLPVCLSVLSHIREATRPTSPKLLMPIRPTLWPWLGHPLPATVNSMWKICRKSSKYSNGRSSQCYMHGAQKHCVSEKMSRIISSGGVLKHTVSVSHYLLYAHLRGMKEELPTLLKCLLCPNLQPDRPGIASVQDRQKQIKN